MAPTQRPSRRRPRRSLSPRPALRPPTGGPSSTAFRRSTGASMRPQAPPRPTRRQTVATASTSLAPHSARSAANPQVCTIECWFKTTTNTGGKLVGFGSSQTGMSANYDRHVYMMNDGQVVFGVYAGKIVAIESPRSYNDGQWHHVVAVLGPSTGMVLYMDGQNVGTNSTTSAQAYTGYWRVGGDNLKGGWKLDPWTNVQGLTSPNSYYFQGSIDEVAVYGYAFGASRVAEHYAANALSH